MNYRYYDLPLKYKGGVALALVFGLIGWSGYWTVRHFVTEAYCNTVPNSTLNRDQNPPVEDIVKAIGWDDSNAEYWFKLAEGMAHSAERKAERAEGRMGRLIKEGEKVRGLEDEKGKQKDVSRKGAHMKRLGCERGGRQRSEGTPVEHPKRGPGSTGQGGRRSEQEGQKAEGTGETSAFRIPHSGT